MRIVLGLSLAAFAALLAFGGGRSPRAEDSPRAVLVVHGGAGVLTKEEMAAEKLDDGTPLTREHFESALADALEAGFAAWKRSPLDAVEAAVRSMEDCELFNAGKGAALTSDGQAELDAAIMDGDMSPAKKGEGKRDGRLRAGAVTGVTHVKNPISAARAVLEMPGSRHVLLAGAGAEVFVLNEENRKKYNLERVSNPYFWTNRRIHQVWKYAAKKSAGTVGAVAAKSGNVVAGTSTGGLSGKLPGRVGDTPVFGAGTYADDRACGVSCTGTGEVFLRHVVAHDVCARMRYKKLGVVDAVNEAIAEMPDEPDGVGGLIALDAAGRPAFGMSAKSVGVYRGYVTERGEVFVAIYRDEPFVRLTRGEDGKWAKR